MWGYLEPRTKFDDYVPLIMLIACLIGLAIGCWTS